VGRKPHFFYSSVTGIKGLRATKKIDLICKVM
jgi:hypothetical protein